MKNRTILSVFALFLFLATFAQTQKKKQKVYRYPDTTFAQTQYDQTVNKQVTEFMFERSIQLEDCKKNEEVIISIAENTKQFELTINSSVFSGKVTLEIYDSKGKKQGTFSVGTQLNIENAETANGTINKSLLEPEEGDWKVKIIPLNAKGLISIRTINWLSMDE